VYSLTRIEARSGEPSVSFEAVTTMAMDVSLTLSSVAAVIGTMLVLALVPSLSGMTVAARSAAFGFTHGASTALGIVVGDIVFILLAILGLVAIADSASWLLTAFRYFGGAYLIWLGIELFRASGNSREAGEIATVSLASSFMAGFLLTLADQKAILFYLVFFPAFIDLTKLTSIDATLIVAVAAVSVGGAKLAYALAADRASLLARTSVRIAMNLMASFVLVSVGLFLLLRS